MKKAGILIMIVAALLVTAGCSTTKPEKIAYLNMDRLLNESQRAAELTKELEDIGDQLEEKYTKKQEELSGDESESQELDSISQEYLDNKQRLEGVLNEEIDSIIEEISEKESINTVLYSDSIYYGGVDITDAVITRLDKNLSKGGESPDAGK